MNNIKVGDIVKYKYFDSYGYHVVQGFFEDEVLLFSFNNLERSRCTLTLEVVLHLNLED